MLYRDGYVAWLVRKIQNSHRQASSGWPLWPVCKTVLNGHEQAFLTVNEIIRDSHGQKTGIFGYLRPFWPSDRPVKQFLNGHEQQIFDRQRDKTVTDNQKMAVRQCLIQNWNLINSN